MNARETAVMCMALMVALAQPVLAQTDQETQEWLEDLTKEVEALKKQVGETKPGTTKTLFAGYASVGYVDRDGGDASFGGDFNPIFLWQLNDSILFEGELAIELEDSETNTELEYSQITFLLNDYMTLGAGKFLAPFNIFSERLHPTWINKLPDAPLAFGHGTGITPPALLGAEVRGGLSLGASKVNYAVYVANGPTLGGAGGHAEESASAQEATDTGSLVFDNYDNAGDNLASGGRVGYLPIPQLELGYSVYTSDAAALDGTTSAVLLQGVDMSYVRDSDLLKGRIDMRIEWVWSDAGDIAFESEEDETTEEERGEESADEHLLAVFDNERSGGYFQLAYQPTQAGHNTIKNLEFVGRYDMIDLPDGSPIDIDEERFTVGINYWLSPGAVIKAAYQFGNSDGDGAEDRDAVLLQAALGF